MGHDVNLSCDTRTRLKKIEAMTGHSFNDMLENAIEEGVAEVVRTYAKNEKYKNIFPKFFPEFDQGVQSLEKDGIDLLHEMKNKFGWRGPIFQRTDVADQLGRDLTDEEWDKVKASKYWTSALEDALISCAWEIIDAALLDAGLESAKTCKKCGSSLDEGYCENSHCPYNEGYQTEDFMEE